MRTGAKIIIFTALQMEERAVRRAIGKIRNVEFRSVGIRAVHLPPARQLEKPIDCLVMAGFAGALDPTLAIGDIVVDGPAGWVISPAWRRSTFFTAEQIVGSVAEKAALFQKTGAAAVEMENVAVRALAHGLEVPFIGIRAISDTADQSLDPEFARWIDEMGRPQPGAVMRGLLARPARIAAAQKLGRSTRLAANRLGAAVVELLRLNPPSDRNDQDGVQSSLHTPPQSPGERE